LALCSGCGVVRRVLLLELSILGVLALYVLLALFIGFTQRLLLAYLWSSISLGFLAGVFYSIASINMLASLLLIASSHVIFNVVVPIHARRCSILYTWDCRATRVLDRYRLYVALALLPVFITALIAGSMARLGLPVTPLSLAAALAYGIYNVYGLLELAGYTLAYITPLLEGGKARLASTLAMTVAITAGAYIEARLILGLW